jgi:hypothetical protein
MNMLLAVNGPDVWFAVSSGEIFVISNSFDIREACHQIQPLILTFT